MVKIIPNLYCFYTCDGCLKETYDNIIMILYHRNTSIDFTTRTRRLIRSQLALARIWKKVDGKILGRTKILGKFTRVWPLWQHSVIISVLVSITPANETFAYKLLKLRIITTQPDDKWSRKDFKTKSKTERCQILVSRVWRQDLYFKSD